MRRVSTDMPNNDIQFYLRRQEYALSDMQTKMGSQTRLNELRDDPMAASKAVRYESYLARLERFEKNTLYARDHFRSVESDLNRAVDVLQRIRELAVKGAHGVLTAEDTKYVAIEMNELLKELVTIANKTGNDGKQMFAGDKAFTEPFRIVDGTVDGGGESMVVRVEYRGAGAARQAEITDQTFTELDISGGEAFWAEKMQIFSSVDGSNYQVRENGAFYIDGVEIGVNPGDTINAIVAKINESSAPVKAYIDVDTRGLVLEGTNAHLIRMEDRQGSTTLQDLGVIAFNSDPSAPNWHPSARVSGGSMFDMVIRLRDSLFRGDQEFAGSQGIGGMDLALGNLATRLTQLGSREERAEMAWMRLNEEIPNTTAALARESSLDFTTAATDLAMIQFAHRASLQAAAKILPPTLLDFLR